MILSKRLSIFIVATLAASALATAVNPRDVVAVCSTSLRCCQDKKTADWGYALLVKQKLGVDIAIGTQVWTNCLIRVTDCKPPVCCSQVATDSSIAIGCNVVTITKGQQD